MEVVFDLLPRGAWIDRMVEMVLIGANMTQVAIDAPVAEAFYLQVFLPVITAQLRVFSRNTD